MVVLNIHRGKSILAVVLGLFLSFQVSADSGTLPLGELTAENGVSVVTETGKLAVDSSYSYFSGDVISTGAEGLAGLALGKDGGIYVNPESVAMVQQQDGRYIVNLRSGSLGFDFRQGVDFEVLGGGRRISSASGDSSQGVVGVKENGDFILRAMQGDLQAAASDGAVAAVPAGQVWLSTDGTARTVKTAVEDEESDDQGAIWPWVLGGVIGAGIIIEATDDDGGDGTDSPS